MFDLSRSELPCRANPHPARAKCTSSTPFPSRDIAVESPLITFTAMASNGRLEIVERDEGGHVTATYVQSGGGEGNTNRVDVILPEKQKSLRQRGLDVFLPAGYPHSVTDDYTE
jgi:hypothetical protein